MLKKVPSKVMSNLEDKYCFKKNEVSPIVKNTMKIDEKLLTNDEKLYSPNIKSSKYSYSKLGLAPVQ